MYSSLFLCHLAAMSLWLGCALMNALCELTVIGHACARALLLTDPRAHAETVIECPSMLAAIATGALLIAEAGGGVPPASEFALVMLASVAHVLAYRNARLREVGGAGGSHGRDVVRADRRFRIASTVVIVALSGALALELTRIAGHDAAPGHDPRSAQLH